MTREDLAGKVGARRETILYHTRSFSNRARFHHYFDIVGATFFL